MIWKHWHNNSFPANAIPLSLKSIASLLSTPYMGKARKEINKLLQMYCLTLGNSPNHQESFRRLQIQYWRMSLKSLWRYNTSVLKNSCTDCLSHVISITRYSSAVCHEVVLLQLPFLWDNTKNTSNFCCPEFQTKVFSKSCYSRDFFNVRYQEL